MPTRIIGQRCYAINRLRILVNVSLAILFLLTGLSGYAQAPPNPDLTNIIPRSPEAGNLGRYGEISVGEYTGTPNISIPLHVIKSGRIEYPLNLYYSASGIRVNQEATWTGLGWDLTSNAGIAYIPVGGNDQTDGSWQPWAEWKKLIDFISPGKHGPTANFEDIPWAGVCTYVTGPGEENQTPSSVILTAQGPKGAKDLYAVNCQDMSFKFYINNETDQPEIYGDRANYKIEKLGTDFLVTNGDGTQYFFTTKESTPQDGVSNWYLSEIRKPEGEWLKFYYQNFGNTRNIPSLNEMTVYSAPYAAEPIFLEGIGYDPRKVGNVNLVNNLYLTEIESLTERVQFHLGATRDDLSGTGNRKLDSVTVQDKFSSTRKVFVFNYDYFSASAIGGNYLSGEPNQSEFTLNQLSKRLKLLSVTEKTKKYGDKVHAFAYQEAIPLPYKTSLAIDHWGYFNGANNSRVIPKLFSILLFDEQYRPQLEDYKFTSGGGQRGSSSTHITSGMLKSITYPTGGRSEFTFEPHTFRNFTVLSASDEVEYTEFEDKIDHIFDLNYPDGSNLQYASTEFELNFEQPVDFMVHFNNKNGAFTYNEIASSIFQLIAIGPNTVGLIKAWQPEIFSGTPNYLKTYNETITLPAGNYKIQVDVPAALGFQGYSSLALGSAAYKTAHPSEVPANYESIGGGLRIKKIENYNIDDVRISCREYEYKDENGLSSGKLIQPLKYTETRSFTYIHIPATENSSCVTRGTSGTFTNSNSNAILSTSPIRATIGYSRVIVTNKDFVNQASTGKVITDFHNDMGMSFFETVIINDESLNGQTISSVYLNAASDTVKAEFFEYEIEDRKRAWINVKVKQLWAGAPPCCSFQGGGPDSDGGYILGVYPYTSFKSFLKKETEKDYFASNRLKTVSEYQYNLNNYGVREVNSYNSKQELITKRMKYPHDFSAQNVYSAMIVKNMVNSVIEEETLKNGLLLERVTRNYGFTEGNLFIKPLTVEKQVQANPKITMLTFDKYSSGGNVSQYTELNGVYRSALWGYNQTAVIASVEHAKLSDVFYNGFEEDVGSNVISVDARTGQKSITGPYTLNLTGLTNGQYTLSYWLKESGAWTLHVDNIPVNTNAYTKTFVASNQLDDVRFYPVDAQMTTFTYDPLFGLTSKTDPNNITAYYEYDSFGRLSLIKDTNRHVVKVFDYNFRK